MKMPPTLYLTATQLRQAAQQLEGFRLPQRTLATWMEQGLVQASVRNDGIRGKAVWFSLDDLVKVRLILRLRRAGEWSPAQVREVLADPQLQRALRAKTDLQIVVTGASSDRVLVQSKRDADAAALQAGVGQYVFRFPAAELLDGNREVAERIRNAAAA